MEINYRVRYPSSAGQEIDKKLTDKFLNPIFNFSANF